MGLVTLGLCLKAPSPPANFQEAMVTITNITLQWDPVPSLEQNVAGPLDNYYVDS